MNEDKVLLEMSDSDKFMGVSKVAQYVGITIIDKVNIDELSFMLTEDEVVSLISVLSSTTDKVVAMPTETYDKVQEKILDADEDGGFNLHDTLEIMDSLMRPHAKEKDDE